MAAFGLKPLLLFFINPHKCGGNDKNHCRWLQPTAMSIIKAGFSQNRRLCFNIKSAWRRNKAWHFKKYLKSDFLIGLAHCYNLKLHYIKQKKRALPAFSV
jgi:hypothetical protein